MLQPHQYRHQPQLCRGQGHDTNIHGNQPFSAWVAPPQSITLLAVGQSGEPAVPVTGHEQAEPELADLPEPVGQHVARGRDSVDEPAGAAQHDLHSGSIHHGDTLRASVQCLGAGVCSPPLASQPVAQSLPSQKVQGQRRTALRL